MTINLATILTRRLRFGSLALLSLLVLYIALSIVGFKQWVEPSLDGRTEQHIGADSGTYMHFAKSLRDGDGDPLVLAAMASFPNTLWAPVLLAMAFKDPLQLAIANCVMFVTAVLLLKRSFSFSTGVFVALLLLNPTTTISLLSVNKEILDFLVIALFLYARSAGLKSVLLLALLIALVNRYEVCAVLLLYMMAKSRFNPWRAQRFKTIFIVVLALDVLLPLFGSAALASRFEEAASGGLVTWLDGLEMHYLYIVVVIPKILENLFAEIVNFGKWTDYSSSDIANTYIIGFNNLANAIVVSLLITKRKLSIQNEFIYLALLGSVLTAVSLVVQPRYFYYAYVLLCLRAAEDPAESRPSVEFPLLVRKVVHA